LGGAIAADMIPSAWDLILSDSLTNVHQKFQSLSRADPVEVSLKNLVIDSSGSTPLQIPKHTRI
jgi:hypothetical protein